MKSSEEKPTKGATAKLENELKTISILEAIEGPHRGKYRLIDYFANSDNMSPTKPKDRFVYIVTETSSGPIDIGDAEVIYDDDAGTISFSAWDTKYIIRPIQDTDSVYMAPSSAPEGDGDV